MFHCETVLSYRTFKCSSFSTSYIFRWVGQVEPELASSHLNIMGKGMTLVPTKVCRAGRREGRGALPKLMKLQQPILTGRNMGSADAAAAHREE